MTLLKRDELPQDVELAVSKILKILKTQPGRQRVSVEKTPRGRHVVTVELGRDLIEDDDLCDAIQNVILYSQEDDIEICPCASMYPPPSNTIQ